jgi:Ca-activated chloride channel family protein
VVTQILAWTTTSGLAGLTADAREFFSALRFARAEVLWLLLLLPGLGLLNRWAATRRRAATSRIGRPAALAGQLTHPVQRRRWLGLAYPLAWIALIVGLAGPRWGKSGETGVAVGRDIVIVVDLSRSMQAPDMADPLAPTRWQAAQTGALDLLAGIAQRGGHRVAIVVFAAHPKVMCPLTTDYDHVRAVLADLDGLYPPPEIRPGASEVISGTRIGEALRAAVAAHDQRFPGYQDVLLISDGDDPADDREWVRGSDEARKAGIPIHTVGLGSPFEDYILTFGEELAPTRLREEPLQRIAAESRGQYIAARRERPLLGEFFRSHLEPLPARTVSDEALPVLMERQAWFLAPALGFFLIGWIRGK